MRQEIQEILSTLSVAERHELKHSLQLSDTAREIFKEAGLSMADFCRKIQIAKNEFGDAMNGTHPYDLKVISLLDALNQEILIRKANEKYIVEFPKYKDSEPIKTSSPT